ncbi:transposase [Accumulibacter sp.]|uniref:transposase n=1 Tax=Accumulibacter sp. TaxID=2053492 RepID=UPI002879F4F8|nr:transposase [Accumulibacter sp.]MDS4074828.1 transposase [Accumulibacter sp.]HMW19095.1 transposase [Accumulibacter sp.]HNC21485.1 transposase [Accumulibacter sp.]
MHRAANPFGATRGRFLRGILTRLRTTNGLERINREIKRRTRVASIFPNPASCLRLVSALLAECDEEWMTGKVYLNLKD